MLTFDLENEVLERAKKPIWVAGIDEVGIGALAGPVTAAAVVLSKDWFSFYEDLNDSKQLSRKKREQLFEDIKEHALAVGVGWADTAEIDQEGIVKCRKNILIRAYEALSKDDVPLQQKEYMKTDIACVVDDHNMEPYREFLGGDATIFADKADEKSLSVAAASIIAKVYRDDFMRWKGSVHALWGFKTNVGYGTDEHKEALEKHGICELHRKSFAPIRRLLSAKEKQAKKAR